MHASRPWRCPTARSWRTSRWDGQCVGPGGGAHHVYSDNARDWVPLVPYLSKGLRLILVDLHGHGQSGKPECCYTRFDFAYDIKLLMEPRAI
ncbi:MAG TPA: alpha/beta fold hydrolase [Steroidobacteraceae bacterium]|nr:alpha/beta fold hydrolase [Steroidobacteraceae bacterium]